MQSKLVAAVFALLMTTSHATTTVSFYGSKDCTGNRIGQYSGVGDHPSKGFNFDINQYVGSMHWDSRDTYSNELQADEGCIFTTITCCQYKPQCKQDVVSNAGCVPVDSYISRGGLWATICDSVCIDTGY